MQRSAETLTNDKKASEEVIMPVDSILFSVAVIAVLGLLVAIFLADFQSRSP
jgi:prefoldin subunit 5